MLAAVSDGRVYYDSGLCRVFFGPKDSQDISGNAKILLDYLIGETPYVITRDILIDRIDNNSDDALYTAMSDMRKKLLQYKGLIKTVRGIGYSYIGPRPVETSLSEAIDVSITNIPSTLTEAGSDTGPENFDLDGMLYRMEVYISTFEPPMLPVNPEKNHFRS